MTAPTDTLERDHELDRIAAALDEAVASRGRIVVIERPPGIGKTRLVSDVRALAKVRGFGRLEASCDELETSAGWHGAAQEVCDAPTQGAFPWRAR